MDAGVLIQASELGVYGGQIGNKIFSVAPFFTAAPCMSWIV